jgi:hypothetical protein
VVLSLGAGLAACSNGGTDLARQACSHVSKSLSLFTRAERSPSQAQANFLAEQAYVQLRVALPLAAKAAAADGQWQALMTTLSETNRVAEQYLIKSLKDQCAVTREQNPLQPSGPQHSIPPPPTNPAAR